MNPIYFEFFKTTDIEDIIINFLETLIKTNRTYNFFVNWDKIRKNIDTYKIELNILNSLIGSKQFDEDLKTILRRYPEVIPLIPILLAIRDKELSIIDNFADIDFKIIDYDFTNKKLSEKEIEQIIEFFDKTGLKNFFVELASKSIQDYVLGIEVGMDTNARKNRSGHSMEQLLDPIIKKIVTKHKDNFEIVTQNNFNYLKKKYGIPINSRIKNRKADFIIIKNKNTFINIETNFYSTPGSKPQEIVDSYIERQNELKENGIDFIWISDGYGWKGQKNQLYKAFEKIDYLLNLHFVREGLLEEILWKI